MRAKFRCGIEISLAKRRPPTTLSSPCERNFQAECFQHLYRCLPDMRFVVANEGVVPQNDFAAFFVAGVSDPGYSILLLRKPTIKALRGIAQQCTVCGKSDGFFHQNAQRREFESRVRQPRHDTTDSTENIGPAKDTFA